MLKQTKRRLQNFLARAARAEVTAARAGRCAARAFLAEYSQPSPMLSACAAVSPARAALPPAHVAIGLARAVVYLVFESETPTIQSAQGVVTESNSK